jgi:hypothetical protein
VNWKIVVFAGLVTLCVGVVLVLLLPGGGSGRIVVPQPSTSVEPPAAVKSSANVNAGAPSR